MKRQMQKTTICECCDKNKPLVVDRDANRRLRGKICRTCKRTVDFLDYLASCYPDLTGRQIAHRLEVYLKTGVPIWKQPELN